MKEIGLGITAPKEKCSDNKCPFHGNLPVRGRSFVGKVVSDKMSKSIVVQWETQEFVKKYERYKKKMTKLKAHNPPCISASTGNTVRIMECRPLSKTKKFVVVERVK